MPLGVLAWLIGGAIMIVCILAFSAMAQKYEKGQRHRRLCRGHRRQALRLLHRLVPFHTYYPIAYLALAWLSARYTLVFVTSVDPDFRSSFRLRRVAASSVPSASRSCSFYMVCAYAVNAPRRSSPVSSRSPPPSSSSFPRAHGGRRHHFRPRQWDADQQLYHPRRRLRGPGSPLFAAVCATASPMRAGSSPQPSTPS